MPTGLMAPGQSAEPLAGQTRLTMTWGPPKPQPLSAVPAPPHCLLITVLTAWTLKLGGLSSSHTAASYRATLVTVSSLNLSFLVHKMDRIDYNSTNLED